ELPSHCASLERGDAVIERRCWACGREARRAEPRPCLGGPARCLGGYQGRKLVFQRHGGLTTIIAAPLSRFGSFNGPTRISARSALAALSRRTLWQGHPGAAFNRIPNCVDGGRLFAGCCC